MTQIHTKISSRKQAAALIVNHCFNFQWFHNANIANYKESSEEFP